MMTFKDMRPNIAYEVTKGSSDETFQQGDIIALCEKDGTILSYHNGWLDREAYENSSATTDFECVVSQKYYFLEDDARKGSVGFRCIPTSPQVHPWQAQLDAIAFAQYDVKFN